MYGHSGWCCCTPGVRDMFYHVAVPTFMRLRLWCPCVSFHCSLGHQCICFLVLVVQAAICNIGLAMLFELCRCAKFPHFAAIASRIITNISLLKVCAKCILTPMLPCGCSPQQRLLSCCFSV